MPTSPRPGARARTDRHRAVRADTRDASAPEQALCEEIERLLRELHPQAKRLPRLRMDASLERDLGFDSLSRMELLARIEDRFRVALPEQAGADAQTPADLLRAVAGAAPRESVAPATTRGPMRAAQLDAPHDAATLADVLAWHAARRPDQVHVRFVWGEADGTELTFGALHAAATRAAGGLQRIGMRPGEPVALMFPTHPDLLVAFFAVVLAGGVPVPLYPPLRASEFVEYWRRQAGILRNCAARFLVVAEALHAHRHTIGTLTGSVERLVTVAELDRQGAALEPAALGRDDLAMLQYTSGSTADPKGVMLSHANLLANIREMGRSIGVSADDTFVSWLPLYHDMGLIGAWLGCLYFGVPLVLMPPQSFLLRPERWLWAIHRYGATLSAAPNFAYELCLHRVADTDIEGLDLKRLRLSFCGAEPVAPETMERFCARFAASGFRRESLFPVYGLAENALALTFPPPGRGARLLRIERDRFLRDGAAVPSVDADAVCLTFVSCGFPLAGHEVRIVDASDRELPDAMQGTIQFRGPSATSGYYRNPELTRRLFHDGWLDTGDLGFLCAGELYLTGRVKDLIIRAGRHLHPQAIEQSVAEVPGVRRGRVAVFGVEAEGTERLVVVAETRVDSDREREAMRSAIQAAVQDVAAEPADDVVLAAPGTVLKTSSGKLRRAACRAAYEAGHLGAASRGTLLEVVGRSLFEKTRDRARRLRALLYAGYAWTIFWILAVPATAAVAILPSVSSRWTAVRALLGMLRAATRTPLRVDVAAPLPEEAAIFVANHSSYLDVLLLLRTLPRPVSFVAKQELSRQPLLRWGLPRLGVAFVDRFDPHRCTEIVRRAEAARRDFLFFPEGTFRRMPGLLPFRLGAFVAAAEADMPVVPVVLRGTRSALRGDDGFPRHGPLGVLFGPALRPTREGDRWGEALHLSAAVRAFFLAHVDEPDAGEAEFEAGADA